MIGKSFLHNLTVVVVVLVGVIAFVASTEPSSFTDIVSEEQTAAVAATTGDDHGVVGEVPTSLPTLVGTRPIAVFLIEYKDSGPRPFTKETARDMVFNGRVNEFFREQSYGKFALSGDVFDWYTIPKNFIAGVSGTCGRGLNLPSIEAYSQTDAVNGNPARSYFAEYLKNNGIDLSKYEAILVLSHVPSSAQGGDYGGASTVGKMDTTINGRTYRLGNACVGVANYDGAPHFGATFPFKWTSFDFKTAHEVSHSLGMPHATGLNCGAVPLATNCTIEEYGNYFDILGNADVGHFTAYFKKQLGWLGPEQLVTIGTNGRYTLNSYEKKVSSNVGRIKTKNGNSFPYYLEYRTFEGFDGAFKSTKPGLIIVKIPFEGQVASQLVRVGANGSNAESWMHGDLNPWVLGVGEGVFTDTATGVTIGPIISADADKIVFDTVVEEGKCTREAPKISTVSPPVVQKYLGESYSASLFLTNLDSYTCGASAFKLVGRNEPMPLPAATSPSILPKELKLFGFTATVPSAQLPGTYKMAFDIVNVQSGLKTPGEFTVEVETVPTLVSLSPSKGPGGTVVTATGQGFKTRNVVQITGGGLVSIEATSKDGKTLSFTVPEIFEGKAIASRDYTIEILPDGKEELATNGKKFQVTGPAIACGDVDGNGQVTTLDILYIRRHILGQATLETAQLARADVNRNGQVTTLDIIFIRNSILGLSTAPLQCATSI